MATINRTIRQFKDLDLNFLSHPLTGDIVKSFDADSINKNLKYLIMTNVYESPFHPEKSSQVNSLLFEQMDYITVQVLKRTIEEVIQNFEPRVLLDEVIVTANEEMNDLRIDIIYYVVNTSEPVTFTTTLKRIR